MSPDRNRRDDTVAPGEPAATAAAEHAREHGSSALLVLDAGETLIEEYWPLSPDDGFERFAYETTPDGQPREDVASIQKSVVGLLAMIAEERGQFDTRGAVTSYLGQGWSNAPPSKEAAITVRHLMAMASGLTRDLEYEAPPMETFAYNTRGYARVVEALEAGTGRDLAELTRAWLIDPLGLDHSGWEHRGFNPTNQRAWVTTARDLARIGRVITRGGTWEGERVVSGEGLRRLFEAQQADNPSYGLLWWLNGGSEWVSPGGERHPGPMIPNAPDDAVIAYGQFGRYLCVSASAERVVVRLGRDPGEGFADDLFANL